MGLHYTAKLNFWAGFVAATVQGLLWSWKLNVSEVKVSKEEGLGCRVKLLSGRRG